mmetsp:Transcript_35786/g.93876  ORF Transcript_35786/g.93876 Transcript_35786/m.93876 type:complete len:218 (-) Transcript_35786:420-1073(-)
MCACGGRAPCCAPSSAHSESESRCMEPRNDGNSTAGNGWVWSLRFAGGNVCTHFSLPSPPQSRWGQRWQSFRRGHALCRAGARGLGFAFIQRHSCESEADSANLSEPPSSRDSCPVRLARQCGQWWKLRHFVASGGSFRDSYPQTGPGILGGQPLVNSEGQVRVLGSPQDTSALARLFADWYLIPDASDRSKCGRGSISGTSRRRIDRAGSMCLFRC